MNVEKQEKFSPLKDTSSILKQKTIAIVGTGGLGSHSSEFMTRMGIGKLILIDDDFVEKSNLSRQTLYTEKDAENSFFKVDVLKKRLKEINPSLSIQIYKKRITIQNADELLKDADLILDGCDNIQTRYLINDYCFKNNTPWIYASAQGSMGTVINFIPSLTPCFRCVFGNELENGENCDSGGIILPALTLTTSIQTTEALKILLAKEPSLEEIRYNVWTREEQSVPIEIFRNDTCACTQKTKERTYPYFHSICRGDSIQVNTDFSFTKIKKQIVKHKNFSIFKENDLFLEAKSINDKRIVAFKTGKIIFHKMSKEEIKKII